jgi:hypothetical protein
MLGEKIVVNPAHTVVKNVGRMKYLGPIYNALLTTTEMVQLDSGPAKGKDVAVAWFNESFSFYSPYAQVQLKRKIDDAMASATK